MKRKIVISNMLEFSYLFFAWCGIVVSFFSTPIPLMIHDYIHEVSNFFGFESTMFIASGIFLISGFFAIVHLILLLTEKEQPSGGRF